MKPNIIAFVESKSISMLIMLFEAMNFYNILNLVYSSLGLHDTIYDEKENTETIKMSVFNGFVQNKFFTSFTWLR